MTEDELPGYKEVGFLQEAIDSLPYGFAILNAEFLPLHVNRVALEAFETFYRGVERGLSYVEATFESVRARAPKASEEECWQTTHMREALLTSGKPVDIRTADGRIFNIVYRPMSGDRYVAISEDVTAQRQMAKDLDAARLLVRKTQREGSKFLANLSHAMRTPLNCILGVAQEVETGDLTAAAQGEHGHIILSAAKSLRTLIDDAIAAATVPKQAPVPAVPAAAQGTEEPHRVPPQGKRILLVDDHPLNRRVGRLYLEPEGFVVSEALNGQHALDRLAQEDFDLILMDIHMPVMGGLEALRQIRRGREAWRNIPVLAFTADAMSGDRERYTAEGMNGYISKPIEKRDLLAEIGRILGMPLPARTSGTSLRAKAGFMSMR